MFGSSSYIDRIEKAVSIDSTSRTEKNKINYGVLR